MSYSSIVWNTVQGVKKVRKHYLNIDSRSNKRRYIRRKTGRNAKLKQYYTKNSRNENLKNLRTPDGMQFAI